MSIAHPEPLPEHDSTGPDHGVAEQSPAAQAAPVTELSEQECWELLEQGRFGRLGTRDGDDIDITPLNYAVIDRRLLLRTARGSKLLSLSLNSRVAFEADRASGGTAWSVMVRGDARVLDPQQDRQLLAELELRPWVATEKLEVVEIAPSRITGRSFRLHG